jgi:multimeric flavodoxin WrbA
MTTIEPRGTSDACGCFRDSPPSAISVLGICASPRVPSNSQYLLSESLAEAGRAWPQVKTEEYSLRGKHIQACMACGHCHENGECVQHDDFDGLRRRWVGADVVIYSVPVYGMGIPGQLKCFLDRLGMVVPFSRARESAKDYRVIGAVAQGIHLFGGQETTLLQVVTHAISMGCIPVSGDMWEAYVGAGGWTSLASDGDALRRQSGMGRLDAEMVLKGARSVGRRAVELAVIIKAGAMANEEILGGRQGAYQPLFDRMQQSASGSTIPGRDGD